MLFSIDTETTGVGLSDEAFMVSLQVQGQPAECYDLRTERAAAIERLGQLFQPRNTAIAHNAQFDVFMLHKLIGDRVFAVTWEDTIVLAKLANENRKSYDLDHLAHIYLKEHKDNSLYEKMAEIFGGPATRNTQMKHIADAPAEIVIPYAIKDAELTLRLWQVLDSEIARQNLHKVREFERMITQVLVRQKVFGVKINPDTAKRNIGVLDAAIEEETNQGKRLGLNHINVNSHVQVKELFEFKQDQIGNWYVLDVDRWIPVQKTKSGGPSLDGTVLSDMQDERAQWISKYRSLLKTRDTFLKRYILEDSYKGRLHPTWNQVLSSGRVSMTGPTLQNVPSRNKVAAKAVRECFEPEEGHVWLDMDLSSHEVRIFAHLVSRFDPTLQEEYKKNPEMDLHQYVADLTGLPRNPPKGGAPNAKQLNLSMIFCMGNGTIAETLGLPFTWEKLDNGEYYKKAGSEALQIINTYHQKVRGVNALRDAAQAVVKRRGYIRTFMGRKLRIPKDKIYKTSAMLIQSTSAEYNKWYLWYIWHKVQEYGGYLLTNIHDSYSVSIPEEAVDEFYNAVQDELLNPQKWPAPRVPILIEQNGYGANWWIAYNGGEE